MELLDQASKAGYNNLLDSSGRRATVGVSGGAPSSRWHKRLLTCHIARLTIERLQKPDSRVGRMHATETAGA